MRKKLRKENTVKRPSKGREFGVDESLLKLFPKVSPMGYPKPSRWTRTETLPEHPSPTGCCHYQSVS